MSAGRRVTFIDAGADEEFIRDPVTPLVELMQREGSVVAGRGNHFGGVTVSDHFMLPKDREAYLVLGYDAVQQVLTRRAFSVEQGYGFSIGQSMGRVLFAMDDPDHALYRGLVARAFTPLHVESQFIADHAGPIIDRRLAELAPRGQGDLLLGFAMPYPYEVIASITGVPAELEHRMAELTADMLDMVVDPGRALAAMEPMNSLLLDVIEQHRREPREDLTSGLVAAEIDGQRLTDDQISTFLRQFVAAGLDTTYRGTGSLLFLLLTHPDQLEAVYADRGLVDGAVEEALRMVPPAGVAPRVATEDTVVDGVEIPAGSPLLVALTAANYDPAQWDEPFRFDIRRPPARNMTFGLGAHICLGMGLARGQIRYALRRLLDRLPHLRPDPTRWPGTELRGWGFRGPTGLPVQWDAA